jgi:serine/threonine protein phosphatase PrpC
LTSALGIGGAPDGPDSELLDSKGCTANVVLIKDEKIFCSNAGDSRCVLSKKGVAFDMSKDHKPDDETEK